MQSKRAFENRLVHSRIRINWIHLWLTSEFRRLRTANEMHSARYLSLFHETPGAAESTSLISIREIAETPVPGGKCLRYAGYGRGET